MQRNSFQDVVPPKRSVRDIPVMRRPRSFAAPTAPVKESVFEPPTVPPPVEHSFGYPQPPKRKRSSAKFFIGGAVIAVLAFIFVMMNAFTSARIDIVPKKETVSFNTEIKLAEAATSSALIYETLELAADEEKEVPANGTEEVARKASIQITVYNNFSAEPQRLIARTRFETPQGLVFRVGDSIVVPGKSGSTPGSITISVTADEAGEKYNIGPSDFVIPGFRDDPLRFKGFYARSTTKAEGGFVGSIKKVSEADKAAARSELQTLLRSEIEKKIASQIPNDSIVLPGGITYTFQELPQGEAGGNNAIIREGVTARAVVLKKTDISQIIQNQFLASWAGLPAEIASYEDITFTTSTSSPNTVRISGNAPFVATIDKMLITNRIVGKQKTELLELINDSPGILSATAAIRPIWKSSFPENPDKIRVTILSSE